MERGASEPPVETDLRLGYERAGGVVGDVAEIGRASAMDNIAGADCKVAGVPHVETFCAPYLGPPVDAQPAFGSPLAIERPTQARANRESPPKSKAGL